MQQTQQRNNLALVACLLFFLAGASVAHASQTSGTIDSSYRYAWSNVGGYVNFAPASGGLIINEFKLTGYAWSANDGWINFSPVSGGVTNSTTGALSGFAWDQSAGWVNFSGVSIDSSGKFHGQATGGAVNGASYILTFDCANCDVRTDWRPLSARVYPGSISPVYIPPQTQTPPQSASVPPTTSPVTEPPLGETPPTQTPQIPPTPPHTTPATKPSSPNTPPAGTTYYPGTLTPIPTQPTAPLGTSTYPVKQTPTVVQTPTPLLASTTTPSWLQSFLLSPWLLIAVGVLGVIMVVVGWYLIRYNRRKA